MLTLTAVYSLLGRAGCWWPSDDPVTEWLNAGQEREKETTRAVWRLVHAVAAFHVQEGRFPPDDRPYSSAEENLYHHLSALGVYADDVDAQLPDGARPVYVDGFGRPIRYLAPPRARNRPYPDIWSVGRDGVSGTGDDITSWEEPVQFDALYPDLQE
jgi:hypothetical protein